MIEEMRLVLSEQEETQTQMDLELDNREAQIHQLTQGNTPNTLDPPVPVTHPHTHTHTSVLYLHSVFTCLELENLKELLLKQRNSKQLPIHEPAHSDDITRAKEEAAQARDTLKVRLQG